MNSGIVQTAAAYALWGLFPLYFHLLREVPAFEVLVHRMVWSLVVVAAILTVLHRWRPLAASAREPRTLLRYGVSAALIAVNWYLYIWAVENDRVLDASLGYFITPLVSVLLGRLLLGERPRRLQWVAIAIAASGVAWLGMHAGHVPWISFVLALSFGGYGLAKKTATLVAIEGIALETALLFPFAFVAVAWPALHGEGALVNGSPLLRALLVFSGPLTILPLLLFAAGARRLPLATLGLLQYITPTMQLLFGVLVFGESFSVASLAGYVLIWSALAIYAGEGVLRARSARTRASRR